MDFSINGIHLQRALQDTCIFFMKTFKDGSVPPLPEYNIIYDLYPDENKFKILSFIITSAIDILGCQPRKNVQSLIGSNAGLWRTLIVKLCQAHNADIHHIPLDVDIIASRHKLLIESLIFDWPFCSPMISQLLEFFCEAFLTTDNVQQPFMDEYSMKFKMKYRRSETVKCIVAAVKWVHSVQGGIDYDETKSILKDRIVRLVSISDVMMKNRENHYDDVWNEICNALIEADEFEQNRIDSYPLYCRINPMLKTLTDFMRTTLTEEQSPDYSKIIGNFHELSERYESIEYWKIELTNTILAALNTVMVELAFRRMKSIPKLHENNLKIFINSIADNESLSQMLILSELNYWMERLKRKKIELPINLSDYFSTIWNNTANESLFARNLEEYFLKVLQDDLNTKVVPGFVGMAQCVTEVKSFQKLMINSLKVATEKFLHPDGISTSIISSGKVNLIMQIIEKLASHYKLELQSHFSEKVNRVFEKFNMSLMVVSNIGDEKRPMEIDDKTVIIPLIDNVDYQRFVTEIWKLLNTGCRFVKSVNIQEKLIDIRHDLFTEINLEQADRIISRIMFFVGWRFKLRPINVSTEELFKFHLLFNFLSENLKSKPAIEQNLRFWMRKLESIDSSKMDSVSRIPRPYNADDFYRASKLDVVKTHVIQLFRGTKNISIPSKFDLVDGDFPNYRKGFETTKAILQILRQVFGKLNETVDRHKFDSPRAYLANYKVVEADLGLICYRLEADNNQIQAELNYLLNIIRQSLQSESIFDDQEQQHSLSITMDRDDSLMIDVAAKTKMPMIKKEKDVESTSYRENTPTNFKRKLSHSDKNEDRSSSMKILRKSSLSKYMDYDQPRSDDDDGDGNDGSGHREMTMFDLRLSLAESTLQNKVNFITSNNGGALGDMIETRISHFSEPGPNKVCIYEGKDKTRPSKYIEVTSMPNRMQSMVLKKPAICSTRRKFQANNATDTRSMYNFKLVREIGEGIYGKIYEAIDKFSNIRVALKRITLNSKSGNGIEQSVVREIVLLRSTNHKNLVDFRDIAVDEIQPIKSKLTGLEFIVPKSFYIVFDYVEHDLQGLLTSKSMIFSMGQITFLSHQLFSALAYLHENGIVHRDVVPSNILISNRGFLKLTDFSQARYIPKITKMEDPTPRDVMTPKVVSLVYRAPEIVLDFDTYGNEIDMWSAGCVLCELYTQSSLFFPDMNDDTIKNLSVFDIIENIAKVIGSPNQSIWPNVSSSKYFVDLATKGIAINYSRKIDELLKTIPYDAADVIKQILHWDPVKRITAKGALRSHWLELLEVHSMSPSDFPDYDCHEYLLKHGSNLLEHDNSIAPTVEFESVAIEVDQHSTAIEEQHSPEPQQDYEEDDSILPETADKSQTIDKPGETSDDELKRFVESLTGRILELGDILDRVRRQQVYEPDLVKSIIMRAAREWSTSESIRIRLVRFMIDYLLRSEEKVALGFPQ